MQSIKYVCLFAWALVLVARGLFTILVALVVSFFVNLTVGPSLVFFTFVSTVVSSVLQ